MQRFACFILFCLFALVSGSPEIRFLRPFQGQQVMEDDKVPVIASIHNFDFHKDGRGAIVYNGRSMEIAQNYVALSIDKVGMGEHIIEIVLLDREGNEVARNASYFEKSRGSISVVRVTDLSNDRVNVGVQFEVAPGELLSILIPHADAAANSFAVASGFFRENDLHASGVPIAHWNIWNGALQWDAPTRQQRVAAVVSAVQAGQLPSSTAELAYAGLFMLVEHDPPSIRDAFRVFVLGQRLANGTDSVAMFQFYIQHVVARLIAEDRQRNYHPLEAATGLLNEFFSSFDTVSVHTTHGVVSAFDVQTFNEAVLSMCVPHLSLRLQAAAFETVTVKTENATLVWTLVDYPLVEAVYGVLLIDGTPHPDFTQFVVCPPSDPKLRLSPTRCEGVLQVPVPGLGHHTATLKLLNERGEALGHGDGRILETSTPFTRLLDFHGVAPWHPLTGPDPYVKFLAAPIAVLRNAEDASKLLSTPLPAHWEEFVHLSSHVGLTSPTTHLWRLGDSPSDLHVIAPSDYEQFYASLAVASLDDDTEVPRVNPPVLLLATSATPAFAESLPHPVVVSAGVFLLVPRYSFQSYFVIQPAEEVVMQAASMCAKLYLGKSHIPTIWRYVRRLRSVGLRVQPADTHFDSVRDPLAPFRHLDEEDASSTHPQPLPAHLFDTVDPALHSRATRLLADYQRLHAAIMDPSDTSVPKRFLVASVSWGNLGNRMLGVTHALLAAIMSRRAIVIHVEFERSLFQEAGNVQFMELFSPPIACSLEHVSSLYALNFSPPPDVWGHSTEQGLCLDHVMALGGPEPVLYAPPGWNHALHMTANPHHRDFVKRYFGNYVHHFVYDWFFRPSPVVQAEVDAVLRQQPVNDQGGHTRFAVAIHLRTSYLLDPSDHPDPAYFEVACKCARELAAVAPASNGTGIYLATDNNQAKQSAKEYFGPSHLHTREIEVRNNGDLFDAYVDLVVATTAERIVGTYYSSFSFWIHVAGLKKPWMVREFMPSCRRFQHSHQGLVTRLDGDRMPSPWGLDAVHNATCYEPHMDQMLAPFIYHDFDNY